MTNLAAVKHGLARYDPDVIQGTVPTGQRSIDEIERYRSLDAAGRRSIVGLQPARAEVILAGACIVRAILGQLDGEAITVSDRGLRHGVLIERLVRPDSTGVLTADAMSDCDSGRSLLRGSRLFAFGVA